jgi:hypothetical protein
VASDGDKPIAFLFALAPSRAMSKEDESFTEPSNHRWLASFLASYPHRKVVLRSHKKAEIESNLIATEESHHGSTPAFHGVQAQSAPP